MTQSRRLKRTAMRINDAKYIALFLAAFCFTAAQSDDVGEERIRLNVKAKIESPRKHASQSTTIISTLGQDDLKYVDYDPYRMSLLVTDKRSSEFSMELTIFDHIGTARDSLTLLATLEKEGSFEFTFDDVAITGTVRIVEVIQPRVDKK